MSDPFVAEIRIFPFNFAPKGWAMCAGQLLPLSQNTALFSLLGTTYGGDGKSTFGLPNLQGSAPMFWGQGPGLSYYDIGQEAGTSTVQLLQSEMPQHNHRFNVSTDKTNLTTTATNNQLAQGMAGNKQNSFVANIYSPNAAQATTTMAVQSLSQAGSTAAHNNMMPYMALNFCIALQGVFPPRG
ncbi:MAG: tail fiber protein [Rhizomicrobium sp.]